jgi:hypothetical protein
VTLDDTLVAAILSGQIRVARRSRPRRPPDFWSPVEKRDGGLWCNGVRVTARDAQGRLSMETAVGLGLVLPDPWEVVPSSHHRVRRCSRCGRYFIGHFAAGVCSEACREARRREQAKAKTARVSERRKKRREANWRGEERECEGCGGPLPPGKRKRWYCSPRCRQRGRRRGLKCSHLD